MNDPLLWFDAKYRDRPTKRWATMRAALNLIHQTPDPNILETGCAREPDDWGAGLSTVIFGEYCARHVGHLVTVDNNAEHLERCKKLTRTTAQWIDYVQADSVSYLRTVGNQVDDPIDLLYLDSLDYPYGPLMDLYGGKENIDKAIERLAAMSEEEIVRKHGYLIAPSQEHCQAELQAAWPKLRDHSVVLIDDAGLPGGGKARLAREMLRIRGWTEVLCDYQSLWVKR